MYTTWYNDHVHFLTLPTSMQDKFQKGNVLGKH